MDDDDDSYTPAARDYCEQQAKDCEQEESGVEPLSDEDWADRNEDEAMEDFERWEAQCEIAEREGDPWTDI